MKAPARNTPTSRPSAIGCAICKEKLSVVDYREVRLLTDWLKSDGRIPSARSTRFCRRHQAQFARAVKRARQMALLPCPQAQRRVKWPPKRNT